ncbi:MAG: hypothetical protein M3451_02575 [Chloroflexota bacterium]|nr:hypothetical protein [Chloroflexota bacterium]
MVPAVTVVQGTSFGKNGDKVRFAKLFLRGLKDVYDQFVLLMMVSVLWWVCVLLIVPGPPATVALFRMADPRNQSELPELRDFFRIIGESFRTAWAVAALTLPVILVLLWNTLFFQGGASWFTILVPLWIVMVFIALILMLYAFATVATMESGVRNAFRGATFLMVMRPFSSGLLIIIVFVVMVLLAALVLPVILFGPAVMASVINRFALDGFDVEVIDPNRPTQERSTERSRGINHDDGMKGWIGRVRGERRGTR